MQQATSYHCNPYIHSVCADPDRLLQRGGTANSFGAESLNMHIIDLQEEIQDAPQREFDTLKYDVFPQEYEGPTYRLDPDP